MKATYDDTILMDGLLLSARAVLAESEELHAGRKVRITLHGQGSSLTLVCPWRVAVYARRAMGQQVAVRQEGQVVFFTHGVAVALYPSVAGWHRLLRALLAHVYAEQRAIQRQFAINLATLKRLRGGEGKEVAE